MFVNQRNNILFYFFLNFLLLVLSLLLLFFFINAIFVIIPLYYLVKIFLFRKIYKTGKSNFPDKLCWKILLGLDFLVYFIFIPVIVMTFITGLGWH